MAEVAEKTAGRSQPNAANCFLLKIPLDPITEEEIVYAWKACIYLFADENGFQWKVALISKDYDRKQK